EVPELRYRREQSQNAHQVETAGENLRNAGRAASGLRGPRRRTGYHWTARPSLRPAVDRRPQINRPPKPLGMDGARKAELTSQRVLPADISPGSSRVATAARS